MSHRDEFVDEFMGGGPPPGDPAPDIGEPTELEQRVVEALREIYDPEIPVNIYDLGLIYLVDVRDDRTVRVEMTLTAPGCPVAQDFPGWVQQSVREVQGVADAEVELVWDPPWTMDRMSEAARLQLGML